MDFHFSDEQDALRSLARKILTDYAQPERLSALEASGDPFDRELWAALGAAGLLGAALAEPAGSAMGLIGACLLLEEIGRHVTALPAWTSACVSAMTIDRFGSEPLRRRVLQGLAEGSLVASAAMEEVLLPDPLSPTASIVPDGTSWSLTGEKVAVPYGPAADLFVVAARDPSGRTRMCAVTPGAPGVEILPGRSTTGEPVATLRLEGVDVSSDDLLGGEAGEAASFAYRVGVAGLCATAAGVLDGGLQMTAGYIAQRQQFGRPIATFQGPAMRIADAYIDAQAVWVSAWSAIWRVDSGRQADEALAIAKFWVADGGQRAVHAFQHLHGGIGMDISYPIHRYFTWAKSLEVTLGGATVQLDRLGASLARGA